MSKHPNWTESEDRTLREHYHETGSAYCAKVLGRSVTGVQARARKLNIKGHGYRGLRANEEQILRLYREMLCATEVGRVLGLSKAVVSRVLNNHGAMLSEFHSIDRQREAITRDYAECLLTLSQIAAKHGVSIPEITRGVRRWKVGLPNRRVRLMENGCFQPNRVSIHECWVRAYGTTEGDRRWAECCAQRKARAPKGKASHSYGKPSPQGSGNGWKGWYRDHYFRSLREACFMLTLDRDGLEWRTGETLSIPYTFHGGERTYRPDYIVGTRLIEVKPTRLHDTPQVSAKRVGAEAYCVTRGLTYELVDVAVESSVLLDAWSRGLIRFDRDYETRFLDYVAASGGLVAY